jgi:hypothetical protein
MENNSVPQKYTEEYIGRKNNYLTVIGITHDEKTGKKRFICKCDCGAIKRIKPTNWANGTVKSCGCYAKSLHTDFIPNTDEEKRLCRIHGGMIQRCYNKNANAYKYYGGRGITVCDEWLNSRKSFVEWALANGYRNDLTIDRINVDGNYEPENCRWADMKTQCENRRAYDRSSCGRKPRMIWWCGEFVELKELCKQYGITLQTYYNRRKKGLNTFHALTKRPEKTIGYYLKVEADYEEYKKCRERVLSQKLGL